MFKKRSFFQKLTGGLSLRDNEEDFLRDDEESRETSPSLARLSREEEVTDWSDTEDDMTSELAVDVYQTPEEIIVKAMAAGVRPEDLDIDIARDMVTLSGSRKEGSIAESGDYITKELYWGSFTRTISLPEEIDPENALATEKNGLIIIRLPKLDKQKKTKLRVKSR
jgi:HSP20 family molecular chaperone IbpA